MLLKAITRARWPGSLLALKANRSGKKVNKHYIPDPSFVLTRETNQPTNQPTASKYTNIDDVLYTEVLDCQILTVHAGVYFMLNCTQKTLLSIYCRFTVL